MIFRKSDAVNDAKQELITKTIEQFRSHLLGSPPKKTASGKLVGATPPNMHLLSKIIFM